VGAYLSGEEAESAQACAGRASLVAGQSEGNGKATRSEWLASAAHR